MREQGGLGVEGVEGVGAEKEKERERGWWGDNINDIEKRKEKRLDSY